MGFLLKLSPFPSAWTRRDIQYLNQIGFHSTFLFLNNNFSHQLFRVFKVINCPITLFSISIVWRSVSYANRILGLLWNKKNSSILFLEGEKPN